MNLKNVIWRKLLETASPENVSNVRYLVNHASEMLALARDTFPTYTMHDSRHCENILAIEGDMLGPASAKLSSLEAAMLILSAYYHDIGMVYRSDEVASLVESDEFREYLEGNAAAFIAVAESESIPLHVLEDFCRGRHAERVHTHLNWIDRERLKWNGVNISRALGEVCQSHNSGTQELRDSKFDAAYLHDCDLRMCAVMLRLGDVLDLDDSRSPASIYEHLALDRPRDSSAAASQLEWQKHLASKGFRIVSDRARGQLAAFVAAPTSPKVEDRLRKFLDYVDTELSQCRAVMSFCSERWRTLNLPIKVDRQIESDGYIYGEHEFNLDRSAVLRLFMGDNLYKSPTAFIRELLQNAIDTCRLTAYLTGKAEELYGVDVSIWEDNEGSVWVRFDDDGAGMDLTTLRGFFLTVGRSYYRSDEFRAEVLKAGRGSRSFRSVSRFGIGVLSCFLLGDRVDVSTRPRLPNGRPGTPVRLQLDGLEDFFVVQQPHMQPFPMPSRNGQTEGYRASAGTSIAVRLDSALLESSPNELLREVSRQVAFSSVPVRVNGIEIQSKLDHLSRTIVDSPRRIDLKKFEESDPFLESSLSFVPASLVVLPLDLARHLPTEEIRCQLLLVGHELHDSGGESSMGDLLLGYRGKPFKKLSPAVDKAMRSLVKSRDLGLNRKQGQVGIKGSTHFSTKAISELAAVRDQIEELPKKARRVLREVLRDGEDELSSSSWDRRFYRIHDLFDDDISTLIGQREGWLSHNGVAVATELETPFIIYDDSDEEYVRDSSLGELRHGCLLVGYVALRDDLRPDVTVSRDRLRSVPLRSHALLTHALVKALEEYADSEWSAVARRAQGLNVMRVPAAETCSVRELLDEFQPGAREWASEKLFRVDGEMLSVFDLAQHGVRQGNLLLPYLNLHGFRSTWRDGSISGEFDYDMLLCQGLMQRYLQLERVGVGEGRARRSECRGLRNLEEVEPPGVLDFPPLSFVRYAEEFRHVLIDDGAPANLRNPLATWFCQQCRTLKEEFPGAYNAIARTLSLIGSYPESAGPPQALASTLNSVLDRLRRAMPTLDIPQVQVVGRLYDEQYGEMSLETEFIAG